MIPPELPIGTRVRVYPRKGDESSAFLARTSTAVENGWVGVVGEPLPGALTRHWAARLPVDQVAPVGARPFVSSTVACPHCGGEVRR